jgi:hypothetical protein
MADQEALQEQGFAELEELPLAVRVNQGLVEQGAGAVDQTVASLNFLQRRIHSGVLQNNLDLNTLS